MPTIASTDSVKKSTEAWHYIKELQDLSLHEASPRGYFSTCFSSYIRKNRFLWFTFLMSWESRIVGGAQRKSC